LASKQNIENNEFDDGEQASDGSKKFYIYDKETLLRR
jgi:hypothetical protein